MTKIKIFFIVCINTKNFNVFYLFKQNEINFTILISCRNQIFLYQQTNWFTKFYSKHSAFTQISSLVQLIVCVFAPKQLLNKFNVCIYLQVLSSLKAKHITNKRDKALMRKVGGKHILNGLSKVKIFVFFQIKVQPFWGTSQPVSSLSMSTWLETWLWKNDKKKKRKQKANWSCGKHRLPSAQNSKLPTVHDN